MRRLAITGVALVAVVAAAVIVWTAFSAPPQAAGVPVPPGGPLPLPPLTDPGDTEPDLNAPPVALAPPGGAIVQGGVVRIPKPTLDPNGQRRVGIQIGHLDTERSPAEYGPRIPTETGTSWEGVTEVDVTSVVADRLAKLLEAQGIAVDILPTTIPPGYVADAFVALHADSDGVGELSGYKLAHSTRRGPYEDDLLNDIKTTYGQATGLDYDAAHVSRNMLFYYALNWSRYQHATSPFTPSVIIELAYLSNDGDRAMLEDQPDLLARGVANGILQFLDDHQRSKLFADDLVLPIPHRRSASPGISPAPASAQP